MFFYETNPTGRILQLLSNDLYIIKTQIPRSSMFFLIRNVKYFFASVLIKSTIKHILYSNLFEHSLIIVNSVILYL